MAMAMVINCRPHRLLLNTESATNGNGSRSGSGSGSEANFDTNMVIILAALLCALICALGVNSIVRCALRCSRRFAFESRGDEVRLAATGLKKSALGQIPVVTYGGLQQIIATDCAICLGELSDGDKVRVLPKCNHGFHVTCIDTWLRSHTSCPTCRHSLLDRPPPDTTADPHLQITNHHGTAVVVQTDHVPMPSDE